MKCFVRRAATTSPPRGRHGSLSGGRLAASVGSRPCPHQHQVLVSLLALAVAGMASAATASATTAAERRSTASTAGGVRGSAKPPGGGEAADQRRLRALKGMMMMRTDCPGREGADEGGRTMMMMAMTPACPPTTRRAPSASPTRRPATTRAPTEAPTRPPTARPTTSAPTDEACLAAVRHASTGHLYLHARTAAPSVFWEEARAAAEEYSCCGAWGHLATVSDADENAFVAKNVAKDARQWIGLKDVAADGPFGWVDGTPFNFTSWEVGRNGTAAAVECGAIDPEGEWTVYGCNTTGKAHFIVEFDCP